MTDRPLSERVRWIRDDYDDDLHYAPGPSLNTQILADEIAVLEAERDRLRAAIRSARGKVVRGMMDEAWYVLDAALRRGDR